MCGYLEVRVQATVFEAYSDEIAVGVRGWRLRSTGRAGCGFGSDKRREFVEGERGEVGAIKGVGIEVEDRFPGSRGSSSEDGLGNSSTDEDEIKIRGIDWRVCLSFVHDRQQMQEK